MPKFDPKPHKVQLLCDICGRNGNLERHHLKRELLFIVQLAKNPHRKKANWYKKLVDRYREFRPQDVRPLCKRCHRNVHREYNYLLSDYNRKTGHKHIALYTETEAQVLMNAFRECYFEYRDWIHEGLTKPKRKVRKR